MAEHKENNRSRENAKGTDIQNGNQNWLSPLNNLNM